MATLTLALGRCYGSAAPFLATPPTRATNSPLRAIANVLLRSAFGLAPFVAIRSQPYVTVA